VFVIIREDSRFFSKEMKNIKIQIPEIKLLRDIPFPFKSRLPPKNTIYREQVIETQQQNDVRNPIVIDSKRNLLKKKFSRKSYSPVRGGYEMDIFQVSESQQRYLFLININTRFLHVFPIRDKSSQAIFEILVHFIPEYRVTSIRGDGETAFSSRRLQSLYNFYKVKTSFNGSSQIYHVKLVDAVIRTIRDGFGQNIETMNNNKAMQQMVNYLNNSVNRSTKLTPAEMEYYPELENAWIRNCQKINEQMVRRQRMEGLWNYKFGDIILLSIDTSKTSKMFEKRRRCFDKLGVFQQYLNGNVVAYILDSDLRTIEIPVQIPIYFTRFCAKNKRQIPQSLLNVLNLHNFDKETFQELTNKDNDDGYVANESFDDGFEEEEDIYLDFDDDDEGGYRDVP
jgi:hypothetical protein